MNIFRIFIDPQGQYPYLSLECLFNFLSSLYITLVLENFQIYGVRLLEMCIYESKIGSMYLYSYFLDRGKLLIPQAGFFEKSTPPPLPPSFLSPSKKGRAGGNYEM